MGSHQSHEKAATIGDHGGSGSGSSTPSRRGSQRGPVPHSAPGGELQVDKPAPTSMVPVEKLAKLLAQRSQKEDGVNGVTEKSFTKYVFPMYSELARAFYSYIHSAGKCKNKHVSVGAFKTQCEKILALLDDGAIIETYVRMFSGGADANGEGAVEREGLRRLLYTTYKISMDHYPEGPQTCLMINKTLSAVVDGCFNKKESHSVGFVVRWLEEHCHRLIFPLHRYCVHMLATRHRDISAHLESDGAGAGLELATPVLESSSGEAELVTAEGGRSPWAAHTNALSGSAGWLLAGALPPLYSRPTAPPPQPDHGTGISFSAAWLARLVCAVPSHWVPLYASRDHGLGANRFLHHTTSYRGPTLVLLQSKELMFVIGSTQEWRETHQYWGGPDCALLQLYPTFAIIERAPKMLYLNTTIRGYPKGLRAGSDPRKPTLVVDEDFDQMSYKGIPYPLQAIEVWGCGDPASRETQLEIKKWQVHEAERQRQIKISAADWIEHPDRYLLELAGRPQYNNSAS